MAVIDHRNKTLLQEGEPFVVRNYRVRAYPNKQLQQHLAKVFGHSRFVNAAMNLEILGRKVLLLAKQGLIPEGMQFYFSSKYGTLLH